MGVEVPGAPGSDGAGHDGAATAAEPALDNSEQLLVKLGGDGLTFLDQFGLGFGGFVDDGDALAGGSRDNDEFRLNASSLQQGADSLAAVATEKTGREWFFTQGF